MFFYLERFSFNYNGHTIGPFETKNEAWDAALIKAYDTYEIDKKEYGCNNVEIIIDEDYKEITIIDHYNERDTTTEFIVM